MLSPQQILGPDGRLAKRLPGYEPRQQQIDMADAVTSALRRKRHLIVEAGTGTGKSFGYLVPAILHATQTQAESAASPSAGMTSEAKPFTTPAEDVSQPKARRVVISTHTISLQEQLMSKDLPLLNSVIPREFSAVLVKGRSNYLSLRRMNNALERARNLFHNPDDFGQLDSLRSWALETADGSQSDLGFKPSPTLWDEVGSDSGNCMGRNCDTYEQCFYYKARRRSQNAQILVVNHALFFADLALRQVNVSLLPDYDAVVFDEAHTLEGVASDHLGLRLTNGQVDYTLRRLYNDKTNKGLLVDGSGDNARAQQQVERCRAAAGELFVELHLWFEGHSNGFNGRVEETHIVENLLSDQLRELSGQVAVIGKRIQDEGKRKDFASAVDRLDALSEMLDTWLGQRVADNVYWIEQAFDRHGLPRIKLASAPLDVGEVLRQQLFQQVPSVIMTSATLATGESNFEFFQSRVGIVKSDKLQVGSPFDYSKQVKIVLVRDMPDPTQDRQAYERMVALMVERHTLRNDGHAFALFTSYDLLRKVASRVAAALRENDLDLLSQADGLPRTQMLERFKQQPRSLLLGADSFWQGVDVAGDALKSVIITKLPFAVPDQPLLQARMDAIKEAGGNPFQEMMLPEAIIRFRQGFGRLVRTAQDTGTVVILDPRVSTKYYGQLFLDALPDCPIVYESTSEEEPA